MGGFELILGIVPVLVLAVFIFATSVRILREYERAVIFRLGRRSAAIFNPGGDGSGPGLVLLIPLVDRMVKVSLRTVTMDVPPQDVITRDNVSVKVNAVSFFRVLDATKAVISVQDYLYASRSPSSSATSRRCGRSRPSETRRPSSHSRSICSLRCYGRSPPRSRLRAEAPCLQD